MKLYTTRMTSRVHWLEPEQLLPGESIIREGPARLRTYSPPFWWEGGIVLTSDRIFFLPSVENPFESAISFWLADVVDEEHAESGMLRLSSPEGRTVFQIPGIGFLAERGARKWAEIIAVSKLRARPHTAFETPPARRRDIGRRRAAG